MESFVSSFQFKTIRIEKFQKEENENKLLSLSVISTAKQKKTAETIEKTENSFN